MAPRNDGTAREAGAISLSQVSTNFGHSSARLRRIKKLQFGIINPEELKQYSVTQAITVNGRKIPAGVTRYEVCISNILCACMSWYGSWQVFPYLEGLCGNIRGDMHCLLIPSTSCLTPTLIEKGLGEGEELKVYNFLISLFYLYDAVFS